MVTSVGILLNDVHKYNNGNNHEDAPFCFQDDNLIIDTTFYNKIKGSWADKQLCEKFSNIIVKDNIKLGAEFVEQQLGDKCEYHELYWFMYRTIVYWYDLSFWYNVRPEASIVTIENDHIEPLTILTKNNINHHPTDKNITDQLLGLKESIRQVVKKMVTSKAGVFVKLQIHSTKYDYPPVECFTSDDVIDHIFSSNTIYKTLYNYKQSKVPLYLFLTPWKENICDTELRVFIENNIVIGISQQHIYDVQHTMLYYSCDPSELYKKAQKLWDNIRKELHDECKYIDVTLDTYIDTDQNMKLIEINCIGGWAAAGSALYNWKNDPPTKDNLQFRFTTSC